MIEIFRSCQIAIEKLPEKYLALVNVTGGDFHPELNEKIVGETFEEVLNKSKIFIEDYLEGIDMKEATDEEISEVQASILKYARFAKFEFY